MAFLWGEQSKRKKHNSWQNPSPTNEKKYEVQTIEKSSLPALFLRGVKGSMTVEASLVLPMCLIFLLNLGSAVEMIRLHNNLQVALWDTGSRLALYGCEQSGNELMSIASGFYVKNRVEDYLGEEYLDSSPLVRGSEGLQFLESDMLKNDRLDIKLTYAVGPLASLIPFSDFRMVNRYHVHLWNGYEIPEHQEETVMVYVAENGRVCHRDRSCTHIRLSVRGILKNQLEGERNQWGSKYIPCDKCVRGELSEILYVTEDGQCFHYREDCPGIKRTVRAMTREEAADYPYCSRCGGN